MKIELFLEFEEKFELSKRRVLGKHYWDFCRIFMFFFIQSMYDKTKNIINLNTMKPSKRLSFNSMWRYGLGYIKKCDILVVSDPRRYKIGDSYMSIFCDPVSKSISDEYEVLTIEEPSWVAKYDTFPPHFSPVSTENILYTDVYEYLFLMKKAIFSFFCKSKLGEVKKELHYVYKIIKKEFDVDILFTEKEFTDIILYFLLMEKTYDKLILKLKPRMLINAYRPTYFKTLLMGICKDRNIPVIELQHGSINRNEPMNKKLRHRLEEKYLPDYIFCYGHRLVKTDYMATSSLKYVGFPFLEYIKNVTLPKPHIIYPDKRYILIISQSTIGDQLATFASEVAERLKGENVYRIIFKFHPNEVGRNYPCLNKSNIIQVKRLDNYIIQFQKYAYCQIGVYSTALYEGLEFLLPTIIIDNLYAADTLIENISHIKKGVYYVKSATEFCNLIELLEPPNAEDVEQIWEKDAIQKTRNAIREILQNENAT